MLQFHYDDVHQCENTDQLQSECCNRISHISAVWKSPSRWSFTTAAPYCSVTETLKEAECDSDTNSRCFYTVHLVGSSHYQQLQEDKIFFLQPHIHWSLVMFCMRPLHLWGSLGVFCRSPPDWLIPWAGLLMCHLLIGSCEHFKKTGSCSASSQWWWTDSDTGAPQSLIL